VGFGEGLTKVAVSAAAILALTGAAAVPPEPGGSPAATSELRDVVARFAADREALQRRYPIVDSRERTERLRRFLGEWEERVRGMAFEGLSAEGRIDHLLLRNQAAYEKRLLEREARRRAQAASLLPFASAISTLAEARVRLETLDPAQAASRLTAAAESVAAERKKLEAAPKTVPRLEAFRAQEQILVLKEDLDGWYQFSAGYDPVFTWWLAAPYKKMTAALDAYRTTLREKVLGVAPGEDDPIVGTPIGREALAADLATELISYTPEELMELGERELLWGEREMKKAAAEMGLGDDWRAALEKVKTLHVAPGRQPELVRDLAREAEEYLEKHDLVTVPPLSKEIWRMRMMSPERQKVNPFFTGGEVMSVSFPTDTMEHADKLMSLRGNNVHFARATVFHELIPGHHLQSFMIARYNGHRRTFETPFWREGWALYWEMLLWDRGFPRGPEDRIGALFWRNHRAARILFSLRFHLGQWTPEQCIDFLVERVGHERANATAEVRRSFNGSYPPLYQLAYMVGGLQFRALRAELVRPGRMTDRQFHDAVLTGGPMPVEMVRARLRADALPSDHRARWRFVDAPAAVR
jgi:uncharacterized protein (DUF885 family)